ncbi:MAG: uncharacterized protein JWM67_3356, partial [Mycobacterium sp.]|jgi:hypothetical protein|nr:uncharacterized protein [Mycobacterium sp.]
MSDWQPDWRSWWGDADAGPPTDTMPGDCGVSLLIASTTTVAVFVDSLRAWPSGLQFTLGMRLSPEMQNLEHPEPTLFPHPAVGRETLLHLATSFADGSRASNDPYPSGDHRLIMRGGGGGGPFWESHWWVAPLPPPPTLRISVEWPAGGLPLSHVDLDTQMVADAARRSRPLFAAP